MTAPHRGIARVSTAPLAGLRGAHDDHPEFTPAEPDADGTFAGADRTGTVRVRVDAEARVTDLEIDGEWSRQVRPDGFAAALFQAWAGATRQAIGARAAGARSPESHDDAAGHPPTGTGHTPFPAGHRQATGHTLFPAGHTQAAGHTSSAGHTPAADRTPFGTGHMSAGAGGEPSGAGMRHRLEAAVHAGRDAVRRLEQARTAPPPEMITVHGPLGYVTVRGRAGAIVEIQADPDAIRHTPADRLRRDALAALRTAQGIEVDAPAHGPAGDQDWADPHPWH